VPLSQHGRELQQTPCPFLDVFGTQDTWQGRRFNMYNGSSGPRGMLQLVQWPVVNILRHVLQGGGVQHLYMMAMTCRSWRDIALEHIEEHAQDTLQHNFANKQQLCKFVDSFGCFAWALRLRNFLPVTSLTNWQPCELDAAFDFLLAQVVIDETSHLVGLKPLAASRWKSEGRRAFELFLKDCLSSKGNYRRILYHYKKAWVQVRSILEFNATCLRRLQFKAHSSTRSMKFSWPCVTIDVHCPFANDTGVLSWTIQDVYNWFRIKKFPVSGLLDLQLDGSELARLCTLAETSRDGDNIFLLRAPRGLGMSAKQFSRLQWFMKNRMLMADMPHEEHTLTFRVGEQKSG
jgi:hypothetical protein